MKRWLVCLIVAYMPSVWAFECKTLVRETKQKQATAEAGKPADQSALGDFLDARFGRYEENFGVIGRMKNNGWAKDDDVAIRGHFSLAFKFCEGESSRIFFSYTTEFDFYAGSRTSDPVINRLNNPAFHWRLCDDCKQSTYNNAYIDIGLEHRSNGQAVEVTSGTGPSDAQTAYDVRNREFFDAISRGSNYLSFTNYQRVIRDSSYLRTRVKLYLTKASQVNWGPLANSNVSIADYDRVNLLYRQRIPLLGWDTMAEAEWTVGDKGFKTDSLTVGWYVNATVPLYVRAHFGPMDTLSNFTQRQDGIWIGVRFDWERESIKTTSMFDLASAHAAPSSQGK